jgi:hypothetical protein
MTDHPEVPETPNSFVTIQEEMKQSFMDYAMSVIVSRALPDETSTPAHPLRDERNGNDP